MTRNEVAALLEIGDADGLADAIERESMACYDAGYKEGETQWRAEAMRVRSFWQGAGETAGAIAWWLVGIFIASVIAGGIALSVMHDNKVTAREYAACARGDTLACQNAVTQPSRADYTYQNRRDMAAYKKATGHDLPILEQ